MENKSSKDLRFDSYLTKTIILSTKKYFSKKMDSMENEETFSDSMDYSTIMPKSAFENSPFFSIDYILTRMELNTALNCLSDIERAVLFSLYNEALTPKEAAKNLEIYLKSVYRINKRAILKLQKYYEEEKDDEK